MSGRLGTIFATGLIGVALIFSACGSDSSNTTGGSSDPEANSNSTQRRYSQTLYSVEMPASWKLTLSDEETGIYLESIWQNPENSASILVEAQVPSPKSPIPGAESVRRHVSKSPGYRELAFGPISLDGRPAARWLFEASGKRQVAYFLSQCEIGITVRGSASLADFGSEAKTFRGAGSSVAPRCG
ncbi:MAG TPA: hypothetical protein VLK56_05260 [Solirubrobacterales bacterium]|nr:hypothetical protein [Solirubrobacterales bacterium]